VQRLIDGKKMRQVVPVRVHELVDPLDHPWTPSPDSQAARDLARNLFPVEVNDYLLHYPRSLSSMYVRFGAEYLAGIAALFTAREVMVAPIALARSTYEHAFRAIVTLDPRVTTRARSARAMLDDVVTTHHSQRALEHLVDESDPSLVSAREAHAGRRQLAERYFGDVQLSGRNTNSWKIEGQRYLSHSEAAESWSDLRGDAKSARGTYAALSLYVHPQAFPGRPEAVYDPETGDSRLVGDVGALAKMTMGALAAWIDAARILYDYHGWEVPKLWELADAGADLNPPGS
jgi:hypothetical protein